MANKDYIFHHIELHVRLMPFLTIISYCIIHCYLLKFQQDYFDYYLTPSLTDWIHNKKKHSYLTACIYLTYLLIYEETCFNLKIVFIRIASVILSLIATYSFQLFSLFAVFVRQYV